MLDPLQLEWVPGRYAVCLLDAGAPVPAWAMQAGGFSSITRTDRELSIVVSEDAVPEDVTAERGWVALRVVGSPDFAMVGVLSKLTGGLAEAGVPVFAISTYETDYLLVKVDDRTRAEQALRQWMYI